MVKQSEGYLFGMVILVMGLLVACRNDQHANLEQTPIDTPTQQSLQSIYFVSDTNAFAIGGSTYTEAVLLHSHDGGQSWLPMSLDLDKIAYNMTFTSPNTGFVCCYDAKILRTTNGGNSWELMQLHPDNLPWMPLYGIDFANPMLGAVAGGKGNSVGYIFRTTDGGQTWQQVYTAESELRDIDFADATQGYAVGYGMVLKTSDGGQTWQILDAKGDFFFALHFPTAEVGYVVGNQGTILKTNDSGYHWETLRNGNSPFRKSLHCTDVWFKDPQNGFVLAENCLLQTADGGKHWIETPLECHSSHGLALLPNSQQLFVVGDEGCIVQIDLAE